MKLILFVMFSALVVAQDSTSILANILADKGTISRSELAQIQGASPADRVRILTEMLAAKGVISSAELARVIPPSTSPVQSAAAVPVPGPSQATIPAVVSQSHFPVTVYGTILVNSVFNTAQMNITDIPLFTGKQGADALGNDKSFAMTARQSRFGAKFESPKEFAGAKLSGTVEFDFLGGKAPFGNGVDMDLLRLRLAYGRLDWKNFSLEAGQDWVIFAPLNPTSYAEFAIPSMSSSGNPWNRLPQIRAEAHGSLGGGMSFLAQVAAMDPDMGDYSTATFAASRPPGIGERGRAPGLETRLAFTDKVDDRSFTVGFSGHYAHGKNSGVVGTVTEQLSIDSWGAALDYSLPFSKKFNLSGEVYTGKALGILSVANGESISVPGTLGDRGVHSTGGWMQAQFNFTSKWQMNAVYGQDSPRARDLPVGSRLKNQSYMGNIIYKMSSHALIAWEYRRLLTDFRNQPLSNERGDTANMALAFIF